jgi:hypothetical protein
VDIHIFPNPVWSNCLILADRKIYSIVLYDARGLTVGRIWAGGLPLIDLPMGGYPTGIYYLTIIGDRFSTTKKILKL